MNAIPAGPDPNINVTAAALARVRELIHEEGNPALKLRVFIEGGGCSGFQYGFSFEDASGDDDYVLERAGVQLLIDPLSMQYLEGAEVDYVEQLSGAQFVVHNPNAKTTCGCGSSFTA
ncbi:MAG TPA: iron-sulfur cluster insertion protein ErpA [Rhodanobacteraceae bacterium]|jgi:iron-sulfur cluster insertion protein|nr:iron-sulfur cluster insertion protein ErpA [Rhodanobacteraceae bacterium]